MFQRVEREREYGGCYRRVLRVKREDFEGCYNEWREREKMWRVLQVGVTREERKKMWRGVVQVGV